MEGNPKDRQQNTEVLPDAGEEARRIRGVHLIIIGVLTLAVLAELPSALSLDWREVWMLPFLLGGTLISWVLHIRQFFPEKARLWFYACMSLAVMLFDGVHASSLFDIAITGALVLTLFVQADEPRILHACFCVYLFLLFFQIIEIISGNSVVPDSLVISRILMHALIVLIIYNVGLSIIRKRLEARRADERIIEELVSTRRRAENFMANVSHELRTPVNVVTGLSGVMEARLVTEEDKRDAAHIYEAGKRLSDHVDDILDYTELETGRFSITPAPYMIASVINDVIAALDIDSREGLPEVIIDVDAAIPQKLLGDARRIKKILLHVADNAIKFTKRGAVYLRVYRVPEDYGINLCFEVSDTGIGMSRQSLERIRNGIYQADAERNRKNTGFGLGLQIVYGMVHAMEGFVRIESEEGEGTQIHISIPQKVVDSGRCMEVEESSRLVPAFFQRPDKFDTPKVRAFYLRMIRHVIGDLGLTLQSVTTIEELFDLLSRQTFTHLFLAEEEYGENPEWFDGLCDEMQVIVVAHSGFRPSPGSCVTVLRKPLYTFPLAKVLNARDALEAKTALSGEEEVRFDGLRALVVDDEEMNLVVARGIFSDYGMEVETASGGQEAIDRVKQTDYDVIFMDHMMPVMDGVEAAHRIRDVLMAGNRKTVIVALTANAVSGAREMFMKEGFDGFVAKPIERKELERTLRAALSGMGGDRETPINEGMAG